MSCIPVPQSSSSGEVQDTRDIVDIKKDKKKDNKSKEEEDDLGEAAEAAADIFGGVLDLLNGALDAAEEIAGNEVKSNA